MLHRHHLQPKTFEGWQDFVESNDGMGITVAPLELGLNLEEPAIAVIAESQLFGDQASQRRRRKTARDTDNIIRSLTELDIGDETVDWGFVARR